MGIVEIHLAIEFLSLGSIEVAAFFDSQLITEVEIERSSKSICGDVWVSFLLRE